MTIFSAAAIQWHERPLERQWKDEAALAILIS